MNLEVGNEKYIFMQNKKSEKEFECRMRKWKVNECRIRRVERNLNADGGRVVVNRNEE